jgi:hypothetical protein
VIEKALGDDVFDRLTEERMIRTVLAAGVLLALWQSPAAAFFFPERSQNAPWCMNSGYDGQVDCAFANYRQCAITLEGIGGYCFRNPRLFFAEPRPWRPYRH